ncbi:hypothetical protein JXI42_13210 [bacterium]|nr:hypothetical protein [bacterium]
MLRRLHLYCNDLNSVTCSHVCDFIDDHPDCEVATDCECCKQLITGMSNEEKYRAEVLNRNERMELIPGRSRTVD